MASKKPHDGSTRCSGNAEVLIEKSTVLYIIIIVTAFVISVLFFPVQCWGLSLTSGLTWPVTAAFALLSLSGLIPFIRKKIRSFLEYLSCLFETGLTSSRILIFSLLAGLASIVNPSPCVLMGDGIIHIYSSYPHVSWDQAIHLHFPLFSGIYRELFRLLQFIIGRALPPAAGATEMAFVVWTLVEFISAFIFSYAIFGIAVQISRERKHAFYPFLMIVTSGTMVLYTGFIEVTPLYIALLSLYLRESLVSLNENRFSSLLPYLFFLCLGLHASAVALIPGLLLLVILNWRTIRVKPVKIFHIVLSVIAFVFLIWNLVGLQRYLGQFFSGVEILQGQSETGIEDVYMLVSTTHLLELANVLLLHNPLNLLWIIWILFVLGSRWRLVLRSRQAVFLYTSLFSYAGLLSVFRPVLGMMRDWDIFASLSLILILSAWKSWEIYAEKSKTGACACTVALFIPLCILQLSFWAITVHNPKILLERTMQYAEQGGRISRDGRRQLGSNLATYCTDRNYFPEKLIDYIGDMEEARGFTIFRVCEKRNKELLLKLIHKWSDKLNAGDMANIGGALIVCGDDMEGLYYLRQVKNASDGSMHFTAVKNLTTYYALKRRPAASVYYQSYFPQEQLQKFYPKTANLFASWRASGTYKQSLKDLQNVASMQILNNGIRILEERFDVGEAEILAAVDMGIDPFKACEILGRYAIVHDKLDKAEFYIKKSLENESNQRRLALLYCVYLLQNDRSKMSATITQLKKSGLEEKEVEEISTRFLTSIGK